MITNFGAKRIIGYWEVAGRKVECTSLFSDPNTFKDEVAVQWEDGSKYQWIYVNHEDDVNGASIAFEGHVLYIKNLKGEDV